MLSIPRVDGREERVASRRGLDGLAGTRHAGRFEGWALGASREPAASAVRHDGNDQDVEAEAYVEGGVLGPPERPEVQGGRSGRWYLAPRPGGERRAWPGASRAAVFE